MADCVEYHVQEQNLRKVKGILFYQLRLEEEQVRIEHSGQQGIVRVSCTPTEQKWLDKTLRPYLVKAV